MKNWKRWLIGLMTVLAAGSLFGLAACEEHTLEPSAKPEKVYEIKTVEDLVAFADEVKQDTNGAAGKTWSLEADLTLTGGWNPVEGFKGVFDGKFHTISGINATDGGLFKELNGAKVKNLTLSGTVDNTGANAAIGLVAGTISSSEITFVTVSGEVNAVGKGIAGGIVGLAKNGSVIRDCVAGAKLTGAGSAVGGAVGSLESGAVVVNVYASGAVSSSAAAVGGVVGAKAEDSAIWQAVAANSVTSNTASASFGPVVGSVALNREFSVDYIIECFYTSEPADGANAYGGEIAAGDIAASVAWNGADWDCSGTPALKTDTEKSYTGFSVKLDGTDVNVAYGNKVDFTPSEANGVAVTGLNLKVGEQTVPFYAELPVTHGVTLTTERVNYSAFVGTWLAVNGEGAEKIDFGKETVTYSAYDDEEGTALARNAVVNAGLGVAQGKNAISYYTGADQYEYRLYFSEQDGLLELEKKENGVWTAVESYMPSVAEYCGVYSDGTFQLILTSDAAKQQSKLGWRISQDGLPDIASSKMVAGGDSYAAVVVIGNDILVKNANKTYTLGSKALNISEEYFSGEWSVDNGKVQVNTETKKVISGANEYAYEVVATKQGVGITYTDGGEKILLVGTVVGAEKITSGGRSLMVGVSQLGTWYVYGSQAYRLEIVSSELIKLNGQQYDAQFIATDEGTEVVFSAGNSEFALIRSFDYPGEGVLLVDGVENIAVISTVIEKFFGDWTMGTQGFKISSDGSVVSTYYDTTNTGALRLVKDDTLGLILTYEDLTFAFNGTQLQVHGYRSMANFGKKEKAYNLYAKEDVHKLLEEFFGEYHNYSVDSQSASEIIEFTEDYKLFYKLSNISEKTNVDFYVDLDSKTVYFSPKTTYISSDLDVPVTLAEYGYGVMYSSGYSAKLYNKPIFDKALGNYYVDFADKDSGKVVFEVSSGTFRINYLGKNYSEDKLIVTVDTAGALKATLKAESGDIVLNFGDFSVTANNVTYRRAGAMPVASTYSNKGTFVNSRGETIKLLSSYSNPPYKYEYQYMANGKLEKVESSVFTTETLANGNVKITITFTGLDPVVVTVQDGNYLTIGSDLFFNMDTFSIDECVRGTDRVRVSSGSVYWNGSKTPIDEVSKTDSGKLRLKFTVNNTQKTLVMQAKYYVTVDENVFVYSYIADYIGATYYDYDGNKIEFIEENGALNIYHRGYLIDIYAVNSTNLKYTYRTKYGVHEVTLDYSSSSRLKLTDYVLDDNNYYMTEAYAIYGGVYQSGEEFFVVEENRILTPEDTYSQYRYNTAEKKINFGTDQFAVITVSQSGNSITYNGKVYQHINFDRTQYYGTFYMPGNVSYEIKESTFTDNSSIKGYTMYNGQIALKIGFNDKLAYLNSDSATKTEAPVIILKTGMLDFVGEYTVDGKTLKMQVALVRNSDQKLESGITATYDGTALTDFEFTSASCDTASYTFNGVKYLVKLNSDSATKEDTKLLVYEESWKDYFSNSTYASYTFNGKTTRLEMFVTGSGECRGVLKVTYDSKDVTELVIDPTAAGYMLSFKQDGVEYLSILNKDDANLKAMTFKKSMFDFITKEDNTVGGKPIIISHSVIKEGYSGYKSQYEITYDGIKVAPEKTWLLTDYETVAFLLEGKSYVLTLTDGQITADAFATERLVYVGSWQVTNIYSLLIVPETYDNATKELGLGYYSVYYTYSPTKLSEYSWAENNEAFFFTLSGTKYAATYDAEADTVIVMLKSVYDINKYAGTYTIDGKTLVISVNENSFEITYDGKKAADVALDENSRISFTIDKIPYIADVTDKSNPMLVQINPELEKFIGQFIPSVAFNDDEYYVERLSITKSITVENGTLKAVYTASYDGGKGEVTLLENGRIAFTLGTTEYVAYLNPTTSSKVKMIMLPKAQAEFMGTHDDVTFSVKTTYREYAAEDEYGDDATFIEITVSFEATYQGKTVKATFSTDNSKLTFTVDEVKYEATIVEGGVVVAPATAA